MCDHRGVIIGGLVAPQLAAVLSQIRHVSGQPDETMTEPTEGAAP
jgi:hypothetical protein